MKLVKARNLPCVFRLVQFRKYTMCMELQFFSEYPYPNELFRGCRTRKKIWNPVCSVCSLLTNNTTETKFTCPPDHHTSIFICPRAKFTNTCPRQSDLVFFFSRLLRSSLEGLAGLAEKMIIIQTIETMDPSPKTIELHADKIQWNKSFMATGFFLSWAGFLVIFSFLHNFSPLFLPP